MSKLSEIICQTLYESIYGSAMQSYDDILKQYPTLVTDIPNNAVIQKLKLENPELTEKELVLHAYTNIVMTYLIFGGMLKI